MRRSVMFAGLIVMMGGPWPTAAQENVRRTQWTIDVGPTWAGWIGVARRAGDSPFLFGASTGFAWELNNNSFDREVWNVLSLQAFGRYQPTSWFSADMGLSVATTSPGDDTVESRNFVGVFLSPLVGYRWVFVGPQVRVGLLGAESGSIHNVVLRVVLPFG